jgi:hypothetical protein
MDFPFTQSQFEQVFATYNTAIWPVQVVAWLLGVVATYAVLADRAWSSRIVFVVLAALWAWTGVAYHVLFFAEINRAAYAFGVGFVVQATLFLIVSLRSSRARFQIARSFADIIACLLIAYGLVAYPLLTLLWTHPYPGTPMFGTTPCALAIFTFGVLLLAKPMRSIWLFIIPALWALIGGSAAVLLDVPEDWILFAALASWFVCGRPWRVGGLRTQAT